jgi:hypothetical protein
VSLEIELLAEALHELEAENERLRAALREVRAYIEHCDHEPAVDTIDAALRVT